MKKTLTITLSIFCLLLSTACEQENSSSPDAAAPSGGGKPKGGAKDPAGGAQSPNGKAPADPNFFPPIAARIVGLAQEAHYNDEIQCFNHAFLLEDEKKVEKFAEQLKKSSQIPQDANYGKQEVVSRPVNPKDLDALNCMDRVVMTVSSLAEFSSTKDVESESYTLGKQPLVETDYSDMSHKEQYQEVLDQGQDLCEQLQLTMEFKSCTISQIVLSDFDKLTEKDAIELMDTNLL